MKILKILSSNDAGGVLQAEIQYIKELRNQGVQVFSIIVGEGENKDLYQHFSDFSVNITGTSLNIQGKPWNKIISLLQLKKWAKQSLKLIPKEILNNKYDAIIFGRISFLYFSNYLSRKTNSQSYYFMHREIVDRKSVFLYKKLFEKLNIIPIANSRHTMESFNGFCKHYFYPGYDEKRTAQFHKGKTFRDEYGIDKNTTVIGIAGRICESKAQDLITRVIISRQFIKENIVLFLAGPIQDRSVFEEIKIIASEEYDKRIIYLGSLNDMPKFYASINVYLNSRRNTEPFGISVVEARASGLPIIAASIGGTAETVEDGYNGWTFDDFDIEGYEYVLERMLREKNNIKKYGENSLKGIDQFSAKINVKKFINLLRDAPQNK